MPSPSDPSMLSLVRVFVKSMGYASELYVVNRAYALVAKGVGFLDLQLAPGRYKVRQRIGYSELVHDLEVPEGQESLDVALPPLLFPSPIPLAGTSLIADHMALRPFSLGGGNFRFILWAPVEAGSSLTASQVEQMRAEMNRLRLESFDGSLSIPFGDAQPLGEEQGALVFAADLAPATYVLVQQHDDHRQLCLPVLVLKERTTAVFSLALSNDGKPVSIQLEHAAVATLRNDELDLPYEDSLLRLEAARKAISAGRRVYGWSQLPASLAAAPGQPENLLLLLLDAQLGWRCLNSRVTDHGEPTPAGERSVMPVDVAGLVEQLERARSVLGHENADIVALHSALKGEFAETETLSLDGPPLLRRSWDQLLSAPQGNAMVANLMSFPFQMEASQTWSLWSEAPGVRATALAARSEGGRKKAADSGGLALSLPTTSSGRVLGKASVGSAMNTASWLKGTLAPSLNMVRHWMRRIPILTKSPGLVQANTVTIDQVETMLAALIRNKSFEDWLNKAQLHVLAEGETTTDESMRRLVSGLRALSDPSLVAMLGPDAVARQALATLRLPQGRVVQLVKDLLKGVVSRLSDSDRAAILTVLQGAVATAAIWLATKTPPRNP